MSTKSPKARSVDPRMGLIVQLRTAGLIFIFVVLAGTVGYYWLGNGQWSWSDCLYMSIITLSTVGFSETLPGMDQVVGARAFTAGLIVLGSGTLLYFASTITAFLVEGDLRGIIREQRMQKNIDRLEDHIILCGLGHTGIHVAEELTRTQTPFVVIETDMGKVEHYQHSTDMNVLYVLGDATEEELLETAGIHRAHGLVASLDTDPNNLFLTVTARAMNSDLRLVAKAIDPHTEPKLVRAGANAVVSPAFIGGMRLVSSMIRPTVVTFLDAMLRDTDANRRIEEVHIPEGSHLLGRTLKDANLRRDSDLLVLAVRTNSRKYQYNPGQDFIIQAGQTFVLLARADDLARLRAFVRQ